MRPNCVGALLTFEIRCVSAEFAYDGPLDLGHQIWPMAIWPLNELWCTVGCRFEHALEYLKGKNIEKVGDLGIEPRS